MKSKYPWLVAVVLMICFLGLNIRGQKQASARTDWEYKSVFSTSSLEYALNDLGAQGWELVAIDVTVTDNVNGLKGVKYYLKRPK